MSRGTVEFLCKTIQKLYKNLCFGENNLKRLITRICSIILIVFSDASDTGLAAHLTNNEKLKISFRNFTVNEKRNSSTWRELIAIEFSLKALLNYLKSKHVLWKTDNYAASCIVKRGSRKDVLQVIAENIFKICKENQINLEIQWVPREMLKFADSLSRIIDYDDWKTTFVFFNLLNKLWGPFTIDRFADNRNYKVQCFNSKYHCQNSSGVDAFKFNWQKENNFLVPPISRIPEVLKHMKLSYAKGVFSDTILAFRFSLAFTYWEWYV